MRVVLGVTGGIAAYKVTELIRGLKQLGHDVTVIPTHNALKFIGQPTLEALSGHPIYDDVFSEVASVQHVALGQNADLVIVAPATASFLARLATGISDDLLGTTLLATKAPILLAPAMHTEMWVNQATQHNVATLRARGIFVLEPAEGALTSGDVGVGRLPDSQIIIQTAIDMLRQKDLLGVKVLVAAGGTHSSIDPVRYIGNHSSGKQGSAIALAAKSRGAEVTLVAANFEPVNGVSTIAVETNTELKAAVESRLAETDVLIMAAAISDYEVLESNQTKIKRNDGPLTLLLKPTEDLISGFSKTLKTTNPNAIVVGFAAETMAGQPLIDAAALKLARKKCDLIVANDVTIGAIFGSNSTSICLVDSKGFVESFEGTKEAAANLILDEVAKLLH